MTALMEPPAIPDIVESPVTLHTIEVIPPRDSQSKVTWNAANGEGLAEAKALYESKRSEGYAAYDTLETERGAIGSVIHEFDETVDIRLMAPMAGG